MVESGMPVDIFDEDDRTALMRAAYSNRTDVVLCLLEKGANVNKQTPRGGYTALHVAFINNSTDVIKILYQHGATTDIKPFPFGSLVFL